MKDKKELALIEYKIRIYKAKIRYNKHSILKRRNKNER